MDEKIRTFIVYVTFLSLSKPTILIYSIKKAQIALLITKKMKILIKYSDFSNVFWEKKALVLPELIQLNQYAIELQDKLIPAILYQRIIKPIELSQTAYPVWSNQYLLSNINQRRQ